MEQGTLNEDYALPIPGRLVKKAVYSSYPHALSVCAATSHDLPSAWSGYQPMLPEM
jgi:hypothetical protein